MSWIEDREKEGVEVKFVMGKVELRRGKGVEGYYDKGEGGVVEKWKEVMKDEYGVREGEDASKGEGMKRVKGEKLGKEVEEVKEEIGEGIGEEMEEGKMREGKGVIERVEEGGFEIGRERDK